MMANTYVRLMAGYGLGAWLRITIGTGDELLTVRKALGAWKLRRGGSGPGEARSEAGNQDCHDPRLALPLKHLRGHDGVG
jgi:hypothetical protein